MLQWSIHSPLPAITKLKQQKSLWGGCYSTLQQILKQSPISGIQHHQAGHHFNCCSSLSTITDKNYSRFLFGLSSLPRTHPSIFWYRSKMSNFMFDCSFRRHTGHNTIGLFDASSSLLLPFIRHSCQMQCLIPNMCPISWVITPAALQKIFLQFIWYSACVKNLGSYRANEKTPVRSLMLARPNTKFHSSLGQRSMRETPMRQKASGLRDFWSLRKICVALSCYFSVYSLIRLSTPYSTFVCFRIEIFIGWKKHSQYDFSSFMNSISILLSSGFMQITFLLASTTLCIWLKQASKVCPSSSWSHSQSPSLGLRMGCERGRVSSRDFLRRQGRPGRLPRASFLSCSSGTLNLSCMAVKNYLRRIPKSFIIARMQLPDEILKQIRLLTDKPVSPTLNKELLPLLLHESAPLEKTYMLLCLKHRADLIIHLLQNHKIPSNSCIASMRKSILTDILHYKSVEVAQIWLLLLGLESDEKGMLEVGYFELAKVGVKQPNLQTKECVFKIIATNYEHFYKSRMKKVIRAASSNFLELFSKFLIYVPSYPAVVELILQVDRDSKQIMNTAHPEREPKLEQIFLDLSSSELANIKNQTVAILENTKEKANFFALHRSCLNVLRKIADTLNCFRVKQAEEHFPEIDIGKIIRILDLFLSRKGTIDQAKLAKAEWVKRGQEAKKLRQAKGEKRTDIESVSILDSHPPLIEDVITMTNNYRLKYQVQPQDQGLVKSNLVAMSNSFLKKGKGGGGGRTCLMDQIADSSKKQVEQKNKRKYDLLIEKCFEDYQKDLAYKSFVDAQPIVRFSPPPPPQQHPRPSYPQNEPSIVAEEESQDDNQIDEEELEISVSQAPAFSQKQSRYKVSRLPIESRQEIGRARKVERMNVDLSRSQMVEDDEEVQEICNLIDLAYSYKFS